MAVTHASLTRPFSLDTPSAVAAIRALDPRVKAYVSTRLDAALDEASALGAASTPLTGVPYGLKDEWETLDLPTTGGSYRHRDRRSTADSAVHQAFRDAGAVLVGKTNLSDMGVSPEASSYVAGSTVNPYDDRRTAGGSSGGAAAAVAFGMQGFDWGTDIGGSIRLPAAFCGVLGLRLSSSVWPMPDMFPTPPPALTSMCGMGPITQTLPQMRAVLDAAAPRLRTGTPRPFEPRGAAIYAPVKGKWPNFAADLEPHLRNVLSDVRLDTDLPRGPRLTRAYLSMWSSHLTELTNADPTLSFVEGVRATLSSVLLRGRFGDRRMHTSSAEIFLIMAMARLFGMRDKQRAIAGMIEVRGKFENLWDQGYVVVAPVCVFPPPIIGRTNWNPQMLACTMAGNLADATGIAIPFGTFGPLPRAIQVLGPPGSETHLLDIAERLIESRDRDAAQRPVQPPGRT